MRKICSIFEHIFVRVKKNALLSEKSQFPVKNGVPRVYVRFRTTNLVLTILHGRRPMMMRLGESRAPFSRLGRMAVALTPLSCTLAYRNGRSLPPSIRSMEVPVSRRLGELRPFPPTMQRQDDVQVLPSPSIILYSIRSVPGRNLPRG